MAKTINLLLDGERAVFAFKPIVRASLYGKRRRLAFDTEGRECTRASLFPDESNAHDIAESMVKENIKKRWVEV